MTTVTDSDRFAPQRADFDRALLMNSGSCKFSTFGEDVVFTGSRDRGPRTYEPGIITPGQHGTNNPSSIGLTVAACERLITDRKIGDPVYIDIIQRSFGEEKWKIIAAHYYLLGDRTNKGFGQWEVSLVTPIHMLGKTETIQWAKEYFERKGWGTWFDNLSNVKEKIHTIEID